MVVSERSREREFDPVPKHRAEWRSRQSAWMLINQARPGDAQQLIDHQVAIEVLASRQLARHSLSAGRQAELAV